jgi:release factor glutamine methyltransferase
LGERGEVLNYVMAEIWTTQRILGWTSDFFQRKGVDNARLSAEVLLAHVLNCDRVKLYMDFQRPLDERELARYRTLISRRADGEPTQYLVGEREFFGRSFRVNPHVLIPRPETELLIEKALAAIGPDRSVAILDLCTGSGCVAVTLAVERPTARVVATDVSKEALAVAGENADRHGVSGRVELRAGDLFEPVRDETFDLLCANPPYVETAALGSLQREIRNHEPRIALDGGIDGLDAIRRIVAGAATHLKDGGLFTMEIGETQGAAVIQLARDAKLTHVEVHKDFARHDRLLTARR